MARKGSHSGPHDLIPEDLQGQQEKQGPEGKPAKAPKPKARPQRDVLYDLGKLEGQIEEAETKISQVKDELIPLYGQRLILNQELSRATRAAARRLGQ